ncbi:MAG TPA: hypothetical protein VEY71_10570 [Chitinophagales bacterium]|nr:hypothetical protein [Chitinophagales bacterium]
MEPKIKYEDTNAPLGWLRSLTALAVFYEMLVNAGRIRCAFDVFAAHFVGNPSRRLPWHGPQGELPHLFSMLVDEKVIPYNACYLVLLFQHFERADGRLLNYASLKTLKARAPSPFVQHFVYRLLEALKRLSD